MNEKDKMLTTYTADGVTVKLTKGIVFSYLANGNPDGLSDADIALFIKLCEARKLNPFIREAYLIKYSNDKRQPATMVVSKDVFMKRAAKFPGFDGLESGVLTMTEDGELHERVGEFYLKGKEELVGGWARGHRKDWEFPVEARVQLEEYMGTKRDGTPNQMWAAKPATMIVKVAEVHALRKLIPEELPGMYIPEEMEVMQPLDTKPVKLAQAEMELPDEQTARGKIEALIEQYQYVLHEKVIESVRLEMEGADLATMQQLYVDFERECKQAERDAEKA